MIEGLPLVSIGTNGLLALAVLFVLTDRLVWHKRLDALQKQIDIKDEQLKDQGQQITMLMESAVPTVNSVLGALHQAADMPPREKS